MLEQVKAIASDAGTEILKVYESNDFGAQQKTDNG